MGDCLPLRLRIGREKVYLATHSSCINLEKYFEEREKYTQYFTFLCGIK